MFVFVSVVVGLAFVCFSVVVVLCLFVFLLLLGCVSVGVRLCLFVFL